VGVNAFGIVAPRVGWRGPGGDEEMFYGFVAENDQRGHRAETAGEGFVTASVTDAANAAWRGPYCAWRSRTRAATSEAVKPLGEADYKAGIWAEAGATAQAFAAGSRNTGSDPNSSE
jgi:hypothetical protein